MRTLLLIIAIVCWSYPAALQAASAPPNIVVIYADDLGYGDIQCYNPKRGKIPTPHVDKLASEGMRLPMLIPHRESVRPHVTRF